MAGRRKVLIVDDDPDVLTQLDWALRGEFELFLADGSTTVETLLRSGLCPDVALVDLHLPPDPSTIDGGIALIRTLQGISAETKIIAISSHANAESDSRSRSAGASILIPKPVERARLLELLRDTVMD